MSDLPAILAGTERAGYVVAPAGFGKTHLIASSVLLSTQRQLILTHTHAGVNALRRKMRELGVSDRLYHIDTIASWALRLSLAYPSVSKWVIERPQDAQWGALYAACASLLDCDFTRRIVRASYGGIYVDEYQDCALAQHVIVLKLARELPCRVLGDPLQGIFDFGGQEAVNWERDVQSKFECLGSLETPHRWERVGAAKLGRWLVDVRRLLLAGQPINLVGCPAGVRLKLVEPDQPIMQIQGNVCRYHNCPRSDTVVAIHKGEQRYKAKCHILAKNLSGTYSSIEEVEGRDLFTFIGGVSRAKTGAELLAVAIKFAEKCMTQVKASLSEGTARGEVVAIRNKTKSPVLTGKCNAVLGQPTTENLRQVLQCFKDSEITSVFRLDLFNRAVGVLEKHALHPEQPLLEAAEIYQSEFRYRGRPVGRRKIIGTTLLVKGLEFDHAIVLDAASLSRRELYVALTRGARSLTIISTAKVLNPAV